MTATAKQSSESVLNKGDKAPDFSLPADGNTTVSLADYAGKQPLVIYFYPKDNTPGCTMESKDFRDAYGDFKKAGVEVLGVSKDSVKSHDNFKSKFDLPFPLISDEDGSMCTDYGVWKEKSMYGKKYMGIERTTVLIDKNGKIAQIWPKVKVKGHVDEVLAATKKL